MAKIGKIFNICHTTVLYHIRHPEKPVKIRATKGGKKPTKTYASSRKEELEKMRILKAKVAKDYLDYLYEADKVKIQRNEKGEIIGKEVSV